MKKIFKAITAMVISAVTMTAMMVNASAMETCIVTEKNDRLQFEAKSKTNKTYVTSVTEMEKVMRHCKASWTDAQKVAYIYTWITNQTTHVKNSGGGVVLGGQSACGGYAGTFLAMARAAGLEAYDVSGSGHGWNVVKVNGTYYCIDNDTGDMENAMFLYGKDSFATAKGWVIGATKWLNEHGHTGINIAESSPYYNTREAIRKENNNIGTVETVDYFEYNGKWYVGSRRGIFTIADSLYADTIKLKYSFNDIPNMGIYSIFNYNNNKFYFNTIYKDGIYGGIYEYDMASNSVKKIFDDKSQSRIVWLGADKYALYYVRYDGTWGTISLAGDSDKLELTTEKDITIKVGEYVFSTPMASTMYKCGNQVKVELSNKDVLTSNFSDKSKYHDSVLLALAPGKCKVTVSAYGRKASYNVTVVPDSSSVLTDDSVDGYFCLSISPGESRILPATKFFGKLPSELKTFGRINRFNMEKQNMSLNIPLLYFDLSELDPNYEKMKNDPNGCTAKITQDGSPAMTGIFNGSQITYLGTCRFEAYLDGEKKTVRIILVPKGTELLNGETKLYVPANKNSSASSDASGDVMTAKIMSSTALTLDKGSKVDVSYLFNYAGDISKINFKSSDDSVASITTSGGKKYIKGNKAGTATISAKVNGMTSYIEVNIISSSKKTSSLSLSSDIYFGRNPADSTLTAKLSSGSTDKLTWVISDNNSLVFKNVNSSGTKVKIARPNRADRNTGTVKVHAIASNGTVKSINVDFER